jgi:hypothetical protein
MYIGIDCLGKYVSPISMTPKEFLYLLGEQMINRTLFNKSE